MNVKPAGNFYLERRAGIKKHHCASRTELVEIKT